MKKTSASPVFSALTEKPVPFELTLKAELKKTQIEMETAYSNFSCATVTDLIDSSIYDVQSIWDRYRYLIQQLKKCYPDYR